MITAEHLSMKYGPVQALKDVSFEVAPGEIVGLLGPNGAGKSTTMKILTTFLHPTEGTAKVGGLDVLEEPLGVRKKIGYLPENLPLYMDMEVREYLNFVGRARGLDAGALAERTNIVLDACGLRPMYRKVIRELSKGYKQRTALAQSLIHDPEIIILDEPTSGLDPHQILEVRNLIRDLAAGKTLMLSTHILQEVEASCDRIIIISQGRIVGNGTRESLRAEAKTFERVRVTIEGAEAEEAKRTLSGVQGVNRVEPAAFPGAAHAFDVYARLDAPIYRAVNELARDKGWIIRELTERPLSLEETFLTLTSQAEDGRSARNEEAAA